MVSKRKALRVDEKVCMIRAIEKGEKKSNVGRRLGLSPSTVATIWKNKDAILLAELQGGSSKKLRRPKFEDLDKAMLLWLNNECQNDKPISGPIIKAKAEKLAEKFGITDFKASQGWLEKFKHRHNITYGKIKGQTRTQTVDTNVKEEHNEDVENDQTESENAELPPTLQEALNAAKVIEKFLMFNHMQRHI